MLRTSCKHARSKSPGPLGHPPPTPARAPSEPSLTFVLRTVLTNRLPCARHCSRRWVSGHSQTHKRLCARGLHPSGEDKNGVRRVVSATPACSGGSGARRVRLHPPHTGKAAFPVARLLGDGPPGHHRPAARQRQAAPAPALARGTKAMPVPSAPPPRKRGQPARLGLVMPPVHPRDQVNTHTLCHPVQPDHTASAKRSHVPPMLRADGTQGPLMAPQGPPMAPRVPLVAPQVPDGTARLPDGARGCDVLHDTSALVRIHLFSELAFTCL